MTIYSLILTIALFIALVIIAAVRPVRSGFSSFELERRSENGDREAKRALAREKLLVDVESIQRILVAVFIVIIDLTSVAAYGWLIGVIVALSVAIAYGAISRLSIIRNIARRLYGLVEKPVLRFIKKTPYVFRVLKGISTDDKHGRRVSSSAELQYLVDESEDVLTSDEKKLIVHGLSFNSQLVGAIMTPRDKVSSIKKSEFLGPLTLDELHKIGYSILPVIDGDIDHIIGVLYLKSLLTLDIKRSTTAEKAMEPGVYYIRQDQTLQHALATFLNTHRHMLIVVDKSMQTVGLLTLGDVIEALLGRKLIDEFDAHDNLRAVASRK